MTELPDGTAGEDSAPGEDSAGEGYAPGEDSGAADVREGEGAAPMDADSSLLIIGQQQVCRSPSTTT